MRLSIRLKVTIIIVAILFVAIGANTFISNYVFTKEYSAALQSKTIVVGPYPKVSIRSASGVRDRRRRPGGL
jgi:hypothetical protein